MFRVFQNGVRCDEHNIPGWVGRDTFSLKRNAEVYAYMWAYPVSVGDAELYAPDMELGKEHDYSMYEDCMPILMKIEEI